MWRVERQEKLLVSTSYIVILGDTPRVAARISIKFEDAV
jgi:hypothetical protein